MIDFHTHILPGIDDGSTSIEESIAILQRQKDKGVIYNVMTPHYYPDDDLKQFLQKRKEAYEKLEAVLQDHQLESLVIYKGAEVLLSVDTWQIENIEALCIEGTNYILIELPYSHWSDWVYTGVEKLISARNLIPILAHVERYEEVAASPNCLTRFLEMGALLQVNAYSLMPTSSRCKLSEKLIAKGMVNILGSDVHHKGRFVTVADARERLDSKNKSDTLHQMDLIGEAIVNNQEIHNTQYKTFKSFLGKWY